MSHTGRYPRCRTKTKDAPVSTKSCWFDPAVGWPPRRPGRRSLRFRGQAPSPAADAGAGDVTTPAHRCLLRLVQAGECFTVPEVSAHVLHAALYARLVFRRRHPGRVGQEPGMPGVVQPRWLKSRSHWPHPHGRRQYLSSATTTAPGPFAARRAEPRCSQ